VVVVSSTSRLKTGVLACEGEVIGEVEGDLLSEWTVDLGLLAIQISCPPSRAKNIDASKIATSTSQLLFRLVWWLQLDIMGLVSQ